MTQPKDPKELLGNVMHLWLDSYIVKNPTSHAPASISTKVFDEIEEWLIANSIEVDYCGWREVTKLATPDPKETQR